MKFEKAGNNTFIMEHNKLLIKVLEVETAPNETLEYKHPFMKWETWKDIR